MLIYLMSNVCVNASKPGYYSIVIAFLFTVIATLHN
jgi:hypothetical protein